jgi:hypothetical protein
MNQSARRILICLLLGGAASACGTGESNDGSNGGMSAGGSSDAGGARAGSAGASGATSAGSAGTTSAGAGGTASGGSGLGGGASGGASGGTSGGHAGSSSGGSGGEASGPVACDAMTCGPAQYCVIPCCGGAPPACMPKPSAGSCPAGSHDGCTFNSSLCPNRTDCCEQDPCTPPPPYCSDKAPAGCSFEMGRTCRVACG